MTATEDEKKRCRELAADYSYGENIPDHIWTWIDTGSLTGTEHKAALVYSRSVLKLYELLLEARAEAVADDRASFAESWVEGSSLAK